MEHAKSNDCVSTVALMWMAKMCENDVLPTDNISSNFEIKIKRCLPEKKSKIDDDANFIVFNRGFKPGPRCGESSSIIDSRFDVFKIRFTELLAHTWAFDRRFQWFGAKCATSKIRTHSRDSLSHVWVESCNHNRSFQRNPYEFRLYDVFRRTFAVDFAFEP